VEWQLAVPQPLPDIIKKLTVEERIKSDTGLKYLLEFDTKIIYLAVRHIYTK